MNKKKEYRFCKKRRFVRNKLKMLIGTFVLMVLANSTMVYAATAEPPIISGTKKLIAALIGFVTALATGFLTFQAGKTGMLWMNASPEEKPKHQKDLIGTIIAGIVTLTIGSTITYIVGFYGG